MKITVTHTLAPEIITLLQGLIKTETPTAIMPKDAKLEVIEKQILKEEKPVVATTETAQTTTSNTASDVTLEQVRAAVTDKAKTKRTEIKDLLTEFGSKNVTELDKEKYAEFLNKVNAL